VKAIALDTCVLGLLTHPNQSAEAVGCRQWLAAHLKQGLTVLLPEIADYELRRELIRMESRKALRRLDDLANVCEYLPITTDGMRAAAKLWAEMRLQGTPVAHNKALDGDVILGAHVRAYGIENDIEVLVATNNVKHLALMLQADEWENL
jgi:predicted nucleic acid-binding protein